MSLRALGLFALVLAGCSQDARSSPDAGAASPCVPPADDGSSLDRVTWDMAWREARDALAGQGLCIEEDEPGKGPRSWFSVHAARWDATVYFDEAGVQDRTRRGAMSQIVVQGKELPSPGDGEQVVGRLTRRFGGAPDVKVVADGMWENATTRLVVDHERKGERWVLHEQWSSPTNGSLCRAPAGAGFRDVVGWRGVPWYATYEATQQALSGDADVSLGALQMLPPAGNACGEQALVEATAKGAKASLRFSTCRRATLGIECVSVLAEDPAAGARAPASPEDSLAPYVSAYGPPCHTTRVAYNRWKDATTEAEVRVSSRPIEGTWSVYQILQPIRAPGR